MMKSVLQTEHYVSRFAIESHVSDVILEIVLAYTYEGSYSRNLRWSVAVDVSELIVLGTFI